MHRRAFLSAVAAGAPWLAACSAGVHLAAPRVAPAAGFHTAIELDGQLAGWASAFGGSQIATRGIADYVPGHPPPPPNTPRRFRDLVIAAGAGMSPAFYAWAAACLSAWPEPARTGSIISVDAQGREIARRNWRGHIDRLEFPALAKNDCAPATLRVQVAVADARAESPRPQPLPPPQAPPAPWRRCHFRFAIAGLERASRQITAVSAFTCGRSSRIGPAGQIEIQPPVFTPLITVLPPATATPFAAALAAMGGGVPGRLAYLAPSGQPILTLHLQLAPPATVPPPGNSLALTVAAASLSFRHS